MTGFADDATICSCNQFVLISTFIRLTILNAMYVLVPGCVTTVRYSVFVPHNSLCESQYRSVSLVVDSSVVHQDFGAIDVVQNRTTKNTEHIMSRNSGVFQTPCCKCSIMNSHKGLK